MEPLTTPGNLQSNAHSTGLTKEQKIGLAVLGCFTLLIIIFWYVQLQKNIVYPLYGGNSPEEVTRRANLNTAVAVEINQDTDGDGLTNSQELTIYKTSPFLADTDGDGFSDGAEVKAGTNPNCPEGKQCSADGMVQGTEQLAPSGTTTVDLFNTGATTNNINTSNIITAPINTAPVQPLDATSVSTLQQAFGVNPDPKYLREQLIQAATKQEDKDALQKISDADLLQMYNSMIAR
jgi:hypothetical protein